MEKKERPVCMYCGKPLRRYARYDAVTAAGYRPASEYGYRGNGIFCTLTCGYHYGRAMAKVALRG